jgi:hypothetical protein
MGMMVYKDYQVTNDKILIGEYKDFFSDRCFVYLILHQMRSLHGTQTKL